MSAAFVRASAWRAAMDIAESEDIFERDPWRIPDKDGKYPVVKSRRVFVRYYEDPNLSLGRLPNFLYDKGYSEQGRPLEPSYGNTFIIVPIYDNRGREAHTYLEHIIRHYDRLDDYTYFLQGNPYAHSADLETDFSQQDDFRWITRQMFVCNGKGEPNHPGMPLDSFYRRIFEKDPPEKYEFASGAQFCVSKERILSRPLWFYVRAQQLEADPEFNMHYAWMMERLWHNMFFDEI